ncbi:MAG: PqqD family peptide modification chaperone [Candidatus Nanoarchaeia archaeon]|nr:PqqD family peptide modification chaperone [Candidatus Nanoarchaeia archaeon]
MTDLETKINKNKEMSWREAGDNVVLTDKLKGKFYKLNETEAMIWKLSDGKRTVVDIVKEVIYKKYSRVKSRKLEANINRIVDNMVKNGFLKLANI